MNNMKSLILILHFTKVKLIANSKDMGEGSSFIRTGRKS